jgi:ABC-type maltose transport system permease subunit
LNEVLKWMKKVQRATFVNIVKNFLCPWKLWSALSRCATLRLSRSVLNGLSFLLYSRDIPNSPKSSVQNVHHIFVFVERWFETWYWYSRVVCVCVCVRVCVCVCVCACACVRARARGSNERFSITLLFAQWHCRLITLSCITSTRQSFWRSEARFLKCCGLRRLEEAQ